MDAESETQTQPLVQWHNSLSPNHADMDDEVVARGDKYRAWVQRWGHYYQWGVDWFPPPTAGYGEIKAVPYDRGYQVESKPEAKRAAEAAVAALLAHPRS